MLHPEALLLIYYQQSQILILHRFCKQRVSAHYYIYFALQQLLFYPAFFRRRTESRKHLTAHRIRLRSVKHRVIVLKRKNSGGRKDSHLLAVHYRLEGRPQRHLGFAVAHVAAKQPVHYPGPLHIRLYLVYAGYLVRSLRIGKIILKLPLPRRIRRKGIALGVFPLAVYLYKLVRNVLNALFCPRLGILPFLCAQL